MIGIVVPMQIMVNVGKLLFIQVEEVMNEMLRFIPVPYTQTRYLAQQPWIWPFRNPLVR